MLRIELNWQLLYFISDEYLVLDKYVPVCSRRPAHNGGRSVRGGCIPISPRANTKRDV